MTDHIHFEQLCDLVDGALPPDAERSVRAHLALCEACTVQLSELSTLGASAASLPREIAPPADLWDDIRAEIAPGSRGGRWRLATWRVEQLAAAAIVIAVSSSLLTVLYLGPRTSVVERPTVIMATPVLPASLAREEARYSGSVEVLVRTLAERRASLSPATIATVEQSLRVADAAIAEARDALARDPANRELVRLFASNYERKIDLLRRATELTPRT